MCMIFLLCHAHVHIHTHQKFVAGIKYLDRWDYNWDIIHIDLDVQGKTEAIIIV